MTSNHLSFATRVATAALAMALLAPLARAQLEFGIPTPMPEPFNVGGGYGYPWLSEDGLDIYFGSDRSGPNSSEPYSFGAFDIWTAHRDSVSDPWGGFANLGESINTSEFAEFSTSIGSDGQELYFTRALSPLGLPGGDLYVSQRQMDSSWGVAAPLTELNTDGIEAFPTISPDGLKLYFNTLANPNYPSPVGLDWNMWVAERSSTAEPFSNPQYFHGGYGTVTPDGLTHVFFGYQEVADLYGMPSAGDADLYLRRRTSVDEPFGPIEVLAPPANSAGLECCGTFSAKLSTLYFTSTRPGPDPSGPVGFIDMWQAPLAEAVPVEIKPGSDPALVNPLGEAVLAVAILSSDAFDASQVDPHTLLFGDPLLIANGATPVSPLSWSQQDVDLDGLIDLALEFSIPELLANEVIGAATVEGFLAGGLRDGTVIAGRDGLTLVPEPSTLLLVVAGLLAVTRCWRK
jgi:hypothetical protein